IGVNGSELDYKDGTVTVNGYTGLESKEYSTDPVTGTDVYCIMMYSYDLIITLNPESGYRLASYYQYVDDNVDMPYTVVRKHGEESIITTGTNISVYSEINESGDVVYSYNINYIYVVAEFTIHLTFERIYWDEVIETGNLAEDTAIVLDGEGTKEDVFDMNSIITKVNTLTDGLGSVESPYQIAKASDFAYLINNDSTDMYFTITKDNIDFSTRFMREISSFNGTLYGNSKHLLNIRLYSGYKIGKDKYGLIIDNNGTITDISFDGISIMGFGNSNTDSYIGLIANNLGILKYINIDSTSHIYGYDESQSSSTYNYYVGGISAINGGSNNTALIYKSTNSATVDVYYVNNVVNNHVAAGIATINNALIYSSINLGSIGNDKLHTASGLVGNNEQNGDNSYIMSSYNAGSVTAETYASGIAYSNAGRIENVYNTGDINSSNNAIGLVYNNLNTGRIMSSYDKGVLSATNTNNLIMTNSGVSQYNYYTSAETTENTLLVSQFVSGEIEGFDFNGVWELDSDNQNGGYPVLRDIVTSGLWTDEWINNPASLVVPETNQSEKYVGAPLDAYIIEDAMDLAWIAYVINGENYETYNNATFILVNDIDLSGKYFN
ncbi:MAG: hypothetical protein IJW28_05495, partial [Clostridia bacterium]|nr:hypothetical protein [Clostridia bacterium]